ncbi:MAG: DUF3048 domain-containing protein [Clostridia bacterium]|nr:DUF3048 domain-containing protein [Clostridia bacterium]
MCAMIMKQKRILIAALAVIMLCLPACQQTGSVNPPDTTAADTTVPDVTDGTTTAAPETTEAPETTVAPETTAAPETTTPPETEPVEVQLPYTNPLTGLGMTEDLSGQRPVAVMINNLKAALPQEGISQADILYECLVEGGITRLMGVFSDYKSLGALGSDRSSRDYYIDFAQNHDAIYICAGGSEMAYAQLYARGINYICGVNMYTPNTFYRDPERLKKMSLEHTLMTSGEGIVSGISFKQYRTALNAGFTSPLVFDEEKYSAASGSEANHLILRYSLAQVAQLIYSPKTGTYYRFQFGNEPHIDGTTGEQLNFTNVLIIFNDVNRIPGDAYNRLAVTTTGTGAGFYVCGGKSVPIIWQKDTRDSVIQLKTVAGEQLMLMPGKTFISIMPTTEFGNVELNYKGS